MSQIETVVTVVAAVAAALLLLKRLVRWVSFPCQFCSAKVKTFDQVNAEDRAGILAYFHEHERREPDEGGLFVCTNCKTVHDDFSGEKKSWDADAYSCRTFCKVCGRMMSGCEPEKEKVACPGCGTEYRWQVHERSGYRFFTPPAGAPLRSKAPGGLDGI